MAHISTVKLLIAWARWGETQSIGYPSKAAFFGERALKTPLYGVGHLPDDVFAIECAVCALEWVYRDALIGRYHRHLTWSELGQRLGLSSHRARRRLLEAEDRVEQLLHIPCATVRESLNSAQARKLSEKLPSGGFLRFRTP
jgi:hypothetical protein